MVNSSDLGSRKGGGVGALFLGSRNGGSNSVEVLIADESAKSIVEGAKEKEYINSALIFLC